MGASSSTGCACNTSKDSTQLELSGVEQQALMPVPDDIASPNGKVDEKGALPSTAVIADLAIVDKVIGKSVDSQKVGQEADLAQVPSASFQGAEGYFGTELVEMSQMPASASTALERRARYIFKTGATYTGQWKGNVRHGRGRMVWPDGSSYVGEWMDNAASGKGRFTHCSCDEYIGEWKNSMAHGYGTYTSEDVFYRGEWRRDVQEGAGCEKWKDDETKYNGQFHDGRKHGFGIHAWSDNSRYYGTWLMNSMNGTGIHVCPDGREFRGCWKESVAHGIGVYSWPNKRRYAGQYFLEKKEGFGVFYWDDGAKYEGYWQAGLQHGAAIARTKEGGVWDCIFKEGCMHEQRQRGAN